MKRPLFALVLILLLQACNRHHYHTVEAKKPRYHKGWYKDHRWHTKLKVGRIHIRLFEKQGTRTVKMKG